MNTNGYGTITTPGIDPYVITVGAMKDMATAGRTDDLIATYSSKGPTELDHSAKPEPGSPGNNVISALAPNGQMPTLYPGNIVPMNYYTGTGNPKASKQYFKLSGAS